MHHQHRLYPPPKKNNKKHGCVNPNLNRWLLDWKLALVLNAGPKLADEQHNIGSEQTTKNVGVTMGQYIFASWTAGSGFSWRQIYSRYNIVETKLSWRPVGVLFLQVYRGYTNDVCLASRWRIVPTGISWLY